MVMGTYCGCISKDKNQYTYCGCMSKDKKWYQIFATKAVLIFEHEKVNLLALWYLVEG